MHSPCMHACMHTCCIHCQAVLLSRKLRNAGKRLYIQPLTSKYIYGMTLFRLSGCLLVRTQRASTWASQRGLSSAAISTHNLQLWQQSASPPITTPFLAALTLVLTSAADRPTHFFVHKVKSKTRKETNTKGAHVGSNNILPTCGRAWATHSSIWQRVHVTKPAEMRLHEF